MANEPASGVGDAAAAEETDDGMTIGERQQQEAYVDFRRELEALPGAEALQALVTKYGQVHGYRTVGRWLAGRAPKATK